MIRFKDYIQILQEGTKDVHDALKAHYGDKKGTSLAKKLLSMKRTKQAEESHNMIFGKDQHHIELGSVDTSFPDKIRHHIESSGDSVDHDGVVTLKSGRKVTTDAYLGRSLKDKSKQEVSDIHSELTNWKKNKNNSNTRLVLSRHPADIASASTGTHWTSCVDLKNGMEKDNFAAGAMPNEIKHGTMIALHVHKDAKPNEDGSYDSKDILGRTLLKLHHGEKENTFFREKKSYGAFPKDAERKVDDFLNKNTPRNEPSYEKNSNVYNDDGETRKHDFSKFDVNNPEHARMLILAHNRNRLKLEPHHIDAIAKNPNSIDAHSALVGAHEEGKIKLEPHHIDAITKNPNSIDAHSALVNAHWDGNLKLEPHHIDAILSHPKSNFAHDAIFYAHGDRKIKLNSNQKQTLKSYGFKIKI